MVELDQKYVDLIQNIQNQPIFDLIWWSNWQLLTLLSFLLENSPILFENGPILIEIALFTQKQM